MSRKFSEAKPLKFYNRRTLLKDYDYYTDYANLTERNWFSSITENFEIRKVVRVYNPQLFGMYLLYKEEMEIRDFNRGNVKEFIMYHATSIKNAESIARDNIDWRKTKRSRYGKGACFASTPEYADQHSNSNQAFVVCRVLVKNAEEIGVRYGLDIPSSVRYDTTLGNNGRVYVKFDDYNFYPEYIVYYTCKNYSD